MLSNDIIYNSARHFSSYVAMYSQAATITQWYIDAFGSWETWDKTGHIIVVVKPLITGWQKVSFDGSWHTVSGNGYTLYVNLGILFVITEDLA